MHLLATTLHQLQKDSSNMLLIAVSQEHYCTFNKLRPRDCELDHQIYHVEVHGPVTCGKADVIRFMQYIRSKNQMLVRCMTPFSQGC